MGIDPLPVPLVILFSRARSRIQDAGPVIVFHMCEIKMQGLMHKIKLQGYKRGQIESIKRKYETEQEPYVQEKIKKKVSWRFLNSIISKKIREVGKKTSTPICRQINTRKQRKSNSNVARMDRYQSA